MNIPAITFGSTANKVRSAVKGAKSLFWQTKMPDNKLAINATEFKRQSGRIIETLKNNCDGTYTYTLFPSKGPHTTVTLRGEKPVNTYFKNIIERGGRMVQTKMTVAEPTQVVLPNKVFDESQIEQMLAGRKKGFFAKS